ncbi:MAG: hypothetical protein WCG93_01175 [Paludibacter sp.]
MKTTNKLLVYLVLAFVPMLFSRCTITEDMNKLQSSVDSLKILVGTPQFNTYAHLVFVDAATNLPIEDKDVKVSISGKNAANIYNNMGAHLTEYTSKWGMLDLVVNPHKMDTSSLATNPLEFIITPTLTGYVGDPQKAMLFNSGTNTVTIPMINLSAPPAGYYSSTNVNIGETNANGQIIGSTPISLASRQFSKGSLTDTGTYYLWFLDNTTLLDASGNTLVGKVTGDFYRSGEYAAWYNYLDIRTPDNYYKRIFKYFVSSIRLYVTPTGGVKTPVANFGSGGVLYNQFLNDYHNLVFSDRYGRPYKAGDKIQRWQTKSLFNWWEGLVTASNSTDVVVKQEDGWFNGALLIRDTLKNVSDLDFTLGVSQPLYPVEGTLNIHGVVTGNVEQAYVIEKHQNIPGSTGAYFQSEYLAWANVNFSNPTGSKQLKIYYLTTDERPDYFTMPTGSSLTIYPSNFSFTPDLSKWPQKFTQDLTVTQDIGVNTDEVTANIDLTVVNSSNKNLEVKPNVNIQVGVSGTMKSFTLNNGYVSLKLKLSQPYIVRGVFGTASAVGILTVKEVDKNYVTTLMMTMGSTPGDNLTYTTTKDASKSVYINYPIAVANDVFNQLH